MTYNCNIGDCQSKFKRNEQLKRHKANIHDIDVKWFKCSMEGCESKFKQKSNLKTHKADAHDIDVKWFKCSIEGCMYRCKQKSSIKQHLSWFHDIGDHHCISCDRNRNSSIEYNKTMICRECYHKVTGKDSRVEKTMSDYLDALEWLKPFLISSDKALKSIGGCTSYRPDKLYASDNKVIQIECDEQQHKHNSGNYSCDDRHKSVWRVD